MFSQDPFHLIQFNAYGPNHAISNMILASTFPLELDPASTPPIIQANLAQGGYLGNQFKSGQSINGQQVLQPVFYHYKDQQTNLQQNTLMNAFSVHNQPSISLFSKIPQNSLNLSAFANNQLSAFPSLPVNYQQESLQIGNGLPFQQFNFEQDLKNPLYFGKQPLFVNSFSQNQNNLSIQSNGIMIPLAAESEPKIANIQLINQIPISNHFIVPKKEIELELSCFPTNGIRTSQATSLSLSTCPISFSNQEVCESNYRLESYQEQTKLEQTQQIISSSLNQNQSKKESACFKAKEEASVYSIENQRLLILGSKDKGSEYRYSNEVVPNSLDQQSEHQIYRSTRGRSKNIEITPELSSFQLKRKAKQQKKNGIRSFEATTLNSNADQPKNQTNDNKNSSPNSNLKHNQKKSFRDPANIEIAKQKEEQMKRQLIDGLDSDSVKILKDSIQMNRQNINRNLIKQFKLFVETKISYTLNYEQEDSLKYHFKSCRQSKVLRTEDPTAKQKAFFAKKFNKFIGTKHHSNSDIKQIIENRIYGYLFREFLKNYARTWVETNSKERMSDYETIILFYSLCLENNDYLIFLNDNLSLNRKNIFFFDQSQIQPLELKFLDESNHFDQNQGQQLNSPKQFEKQPESESENQKVQFPPQQ